VEVKGMKRCNPKILCCIVTLLAGLAGGGLACAAPDTPLDASKKLEEMPVMTGQEWQVMNPDAKIAFVWGIGHVVTVEEHVVNRHPELKRNDFVAKLGEGLKGIPMRDIVQRVNDFYKGNPDAINLPVMRVIWGQIVKPRLSSGVADQPLQKDEEQQK
jgi:hypothetical protein